MRPFFPFVAASFLIPCLAAIPASAAPPPAPTAAEIAAENAAKLAAKRDPHLRAAELLQHGTELKAQDKCEQAILPLESAWGLEKNLTTATLLGECEVKLARWVPAARHLGLVLQDKPEGPERARLDALFKQARAQVCGVTVQSSLDGADVFADDQLVGRTPLHSEVFVEPGDATITLKKTSVGEVAQVVHVAKGASTTVHLEPARANVEDERLIAPEGRSRIPVFVFAGAALAAAGAGVGLRVLGGTQGATANDALDTLRASTSTRYPCVDKANDVVCQGIKDARVKHDGYINGSTALFVVGGAALAASITYALWPSASTSSTGREHALTLSPAISPSAGGVFAQGTF
jgi:hypothetical protein